MRPITTDITQGVVCLCVCLSVLVTQMRPAKLAEPIEGLTLVGPVLDGGQDLMNPFAAGRGD